jgi:phosphoribosylformylglycinamidine synthase
MLGVMDDISWHTTLHFKKPGHVIYMLGTPVNDLGSSEYCRTVLGIPLSAPPSFDMDEELHLQQNITQLIRKKYIESAHDISEGGLFHCLLESAIAGNVGFDIETDSNFRKDAYLFGESQSRCVVTINPQKEDAVVNFLNTHNVPFSRIGEVIKDEIKIDTESFGNIGEYTKIFNNTLGQKMAGVQN